MPDDIFIAIFLWEFQHLRWYRLIYSYCSKQVIFSEIAPDPTLLKNYSRPGITLKNSLYVTLQKLGNQNNFREYRVSTKIIRLINKLEAKVVVSCNRN